VFAAPFNTTGKGLYCWWRGAWWLEASLVVGLMKKPS
jgi:hypothetical protein